MWFNRGIRINQCSSAIDTSAISSCRICKRDSTLVVKGDKRGLILCCFSPNSSFIMSNFVVHVCYLHFALLFLFKPFPNKPWFLLVCRTSLLKTPWEKEKLLVTSNFSFSHSVFYPFGELSAFFIKFEIVVCKLFQFGRV